MEKSLIYICTIFREEPIFSSIPQITYSAPTQIDYGDFVDASIDSRGERDAYTFSGKAGDITGLAYDVLTPSFLWKGNGRYIVSGIGMWLQGGTSASGVISISGIPRGLPLKLLSFIGLLGKRLTHLALRSQSTTCRLRKN